MTPLAIQVAEAVTMVHQRWPHNARVGLILGTGLGHLADQVEHEAIIAYDDIPHFPRSTALSHKGQLVCGRLAGVPVLTMEGRSHLYEGYSADEVTFPIRVMRGLGAELLIVSNASGGLNPRYASGDVMVVADHIHLMFRCPEAANSDEQRPIERIGRNVAPLYDPALVERSLEIARRENFVAHRGVYVAVTGPNYETRAEYRFLRRIGGDVVGMSTVPEVLVASQLGMRVLALSTVTNVARPDAPHIVKAAEVVSVAEHAEPNLRNIVQGIIHSVT